MWSGARFDIRTFLVFIKDLPGCLSYAIPNMYADDTSITSGNENLNVLENRINADLASLNKCLKANHLSLNMIKSEYMIIGSAPRLNNLGAEPSLRIGNVNMKRVTCKKILGVVLTKILAGMII